MAEFCGPCPNRGDCVGEISASVDITVVPGTDMYDELGSVEYSRQNQPHTKVDVYFTDSDGMRSDGFSERIEHHIVGQETIDRAEARVAERLEDRVENCNDSRPDACAPYNKRTVISLANKALGGDL